MLIYFAFNSDCLCWRNFDSFFVYNYDVNLRVVESYSTFYNYLPLGSFIGFFWLVEVFFFIFFDFGGFHNFASVTASEINLLTFVKSYSI